MAMPTLVLQYPDIQTGKIRILACTRNPQALAVFKDVVLREALLSALMADDEILRVEYSEEYTKLEKLLPLLIPDEEVDGK